MFPSLRAIFARVAPVRERGLKYYIYINAGVFPLSRSREGAWIEIRKYSCLSINAIVAPVRERGLK